MRGKSAFEFLRAFSVVFWLATLAYVLAGQSVIKAYNLEYALWALLVGLIISNTVGTPAYLKPATLTEFYIKTGLVLLGAEVLMSRLLALGLPGIFVAWVVTPIVLISTYIFGQKVLKMESRSLNMVISADMSVCGVSAAIATAAACKAKKEELSLAIGMSLSFTVIMMVVMPAMIRAVGMDEILGGAWLGGTIDSTGAVAAAGAMLGDRALEVAATVKMIQNILIGVTAFCVAIYWVTFVERDPSGRPARCDGNLVSLSEIRDRLRAGVNRFFSGVFPRDRWAGTGRRHDQGVNQDIARLVLLPGLCQYRTGNELPRTAAISARRQALDSVRLRPDAQPASDAVHGVADVWRDLR